VTRASSVAILSVAVIIMTASAIGADDGWRTEPPITYVLDYGRDHLGHPEYIEAVAGSPPTLLHLGKDVVMTHNWGPVQGLGGENQAGGKGDAIRRLSPEETQERLEGLTDMAAALHEAGCKYVTPYICSMTLGGSHRTRAGFWEFYDHWNEYLRFGLPPRPKLDPVDWMQRNPDGTMKSTYGCKPDTSEFYPPYEPNLRYAACVNNPGWRTWIDAVARLVATVGYDGAFIDNSGTQQCYCEFCQEKFQRFLRNKYTPTEMKELFGVDEGQPVPLAERPGADGELTLAWVESQRFWVESLHQHQLAIRKAGEEVGGHFILFPNGGHHRPNHVKLAFCDSDYIMYELSVGDYGTHPGLVRSRIVDDIYMQVHNDHCWQFKYTQAVRRRVKALVLTRAGYPKTRASLELNVNTAALGMAEAATFGSGAGFLLRPRWDEYRDVLNQYRRFFEEHADLYTGLVPYAQVAVAAFSEQNFYGNDKQIAQARKVTAELLGSHILFDYVTEDYFTAENLANYRAVIFPQVVYANPDQIAALTEYVQGGGVALVLGVTPTADMCLRPYDPPPLAEKLGLPQEGPAGEKTLSDGKGTWLYADQMPGNGLRKALHTALGEDVAVMAGGSEAVRFNAFVHLDEGFLMLHVLNYDVPLGVDEEPVADKSNLTLSIPLPEGAKATSAQAYDPDQAQPETLAVRTADGRAELTLPDLRIYKAVKIQVQ